MLRAVFARTLKAGVTDEQFIRAWMPTALTADSYPSAVTISHSPTDDRQIISIFEVDAATADLPEVLAVLVHPDSARRLAELVESTQLEGFFEDTATFGASRPLGSNSAT